MLTNDESTLLIGSVAILYLILIWLIYKRESETCWLRAAIWAHKNTMTAGHGYFSGILSVPIRDLQHLDLCLMTKRENDEVVTRDGSRSWFKMIRLDFFTTYEKRITKNKL